MVLYTVLIGLATYKAVQFVVALLYPRLVFPPVVKHAMAITCACVMAHMLDIKDWWLIGGAAAAVASGFHITMRWLYTSGSVQKLAANVQRRR